MEHQQYVLQILMYNMNLAQNRMKQQAYQEHSEHSFNVGDWVFLRLQPYKQMSQKKTKNHLSTMVPTRLLGIMIQNVIIRSLV